MEYLKNPRFIGALIVLVIAIALIKLSPVVLKNSKSSHDKTNTSKNTADNRNSSAYKGAGGLFSLKKRGSQDRLTPEEKKENKREFARMREKIPGNMYIPGKLSESEANKHRKFLKEIILLSNKVRKKTATVEETKKYYSMRIRQTSDKVEFMNYISNRILEKRTETGKEYLNDEMLKQVNLATQKNIKELQTYKDKLNRLQ